MSVAGFNPQMRRHESIVVIRIGAAADRIPHCGVLSVRGPEALESVVHSRGGGGPLEFAPGSRGSRGGAPGVWGWSWSPFPHCGAIVG